MDGKPLNARRWHFNLLPRKPDMFIGGEVRPYIRRWYVISTPLFRIYLHNMLRNDDDRALHDHPWNNVSIILAGGFVEVTPNGRYPRRPGSITMRQATDSHRLELPYKVHSSWSLFLTGRHQRKWGFHCPKGWIPYEQFVKPNAPGEIGAGCP
jgi:hypothetical protein